MCQQAINIYNHSSTHLLTMQAKIEVFAKVEFSRKFKQFKQFEFLLIYNRKNTFGSYIILAQTCFFYLLYYFTKCRFSITKSKKSLWSIISNIVYPRNFTIIFRYYSYLPPVLGKTFNLNQLNRLEQCLPLHYY